MGVYVKVDLKEMVYQRSDEKFLVQERTSEGLL
jgi:hypothetical protein